MQAWSHSLTLYGSEHTQTRTCGSEILLSLNWNKSVKCLFKASSTIFSLVCILLFYFRTSLLLTDAGDNFNEHRLSTGIWAPPWPAVGTSALLSSSGAWGGFPAPPTGATQVRSYSVCSLRSAPRASEGSVLGPKLISMLQNVLSD